MAGQRVDERAALKIVARARGVSKSDAYRVCRPKKTARASFPSEALGAVHGKRGPPEADSHDIESLVIFVTADDGGFGEEIRRALPGPIGPRPGMVTVRVVRRANSFLVRKDRPRRLTSSAVVVSSKGSPNESTPCTRRARAASTRR